MLFEFKKFKSAKLIYMRLGQQGYYKAIVMKEDGFSIVRWFASLRVRISPMYRHF
jgi:hypothetical protein